MSLVITIGRQNGSGGHQVAEKLCEKLGFALYDNNLLEMVAQEGDDNPSEVERHDEKAPGGFWSRLAQAKNYDQIDPPLTPDTVFAAQTRLILKAAETGKCVIVGRAANYILAKRRETVKVFLTAPLEDRARRKMAMLPEGSGVTPEDMRKLLVKMDEARAKFYRHYTGSLWGAAEGYDLVINTGKVGVDGAVELILAFIEKAKAGSDLADGVTRGK